MAIKIDLMSGPNKKGPDWTALDLRAFPGVDHVMNIGTERWPFDDGTVEEGWCNHGLEHLLPMERVHFMNELCRVLIPGKSATLVTPHWASTRAYGDMDHKWPPVSEMFYFYLNAEWRKGNAPHDDWYTCNFACPPGIGHAMHPELIARDDQHKAWMLAFAKEACQDLIVTITKM